MAGTAIPGLPENLQSELEQAARAQGRAVEEVLTDAVQGYLNEQGWRRLVQNGRKRSAELGLTEADVPRLIDESRAEHSR
jgi:hypothetical protein